jgi:hypothetical protein
MAATTTAARVKKALANPEPSTHGPSRRIRYLAHVRSWWKRKLWTIDLRRDSRHPDLGNRFLERLLTGIAPTALRHRGRTAVFHL